jgi:hypothetical protein
MQGVRRCGQFFGWLVPGADLDLIRDAVQDGRRAAKPIDRRVATLLPRYTATPLFCDTAKPLRGHTATRRPDAFQQRSNRCQQALFISGFSRSFVAHVVGRMNRIAGARSKLAEPGHACLIHSAERIFK